MDGNMIKDINIELEGNGSGQVRIGGEIVQGVVGVKVKDRVGENPIVTLEMIPTDGGLVVGDAEIKVKLGGRRYRLVEQRHEEPEQDGEVRTFQGKVCEITTQYGVRHFLRHENAFPEDTALRTSDAWNWLRGLSGRSVCLTVEVLE